MKTPVLLIILLLTVNSNSSLVSEFLQLGQRLGSYTTTEEILKIQASSLKPSGFDPSFYLNPWGPLGYLGPLGPYGPLGMLGPIGDNSWNPSKAFNFTSTMSSDIQKNYQYQIALKGGALSEAGPLGKNGPVSIDQYYGKVNPGKALFSVKNTFAYQLRGMGLFSTLGPIGPLGALGALGPLGQLGPLGNNRDSNGNYLQGGNIIKSVKVGKSFDLFEVYPESYAKTAALDTSFMVRGSSSSEEDVFSFQNKEDQLVTFVLTPEMQLDDFDLALYNQNGQQIAKSATFNYIDTIHAFLPKGNYKVGVKLRQSFHYLVSTYRVYVTGAGKDLSVIDISGSHVKQLKL